MAEVLCVAAGLSPAATHGISAVWKRYRKLYWVLEGVGLWLGPWSGLVESDPGAI